jgi:quercetin dioxygenase-like cupin family protein
VRVPVFDRPRLAAELVCLVPEQKETRRNQDICDELFVVIEGTGTLRSGSTVQELEPSDAVVVPPGVERTLINSGSTPLTVLVALSPKPSFANQSSPRRPVTRREADEEAVEEEPTEQAGFDESRSGPSIGRPKRAVSPQTNEDRPRGPARGGFGAMRRDTFNNHPSRRDDDAPQQGDDAPERRPFNRDDRPRTPRPAYGARPTSGARPLRPRNNEGVDRPAFNRDDGPRPPRAPYGASRGRPFTPRDDGARPFNDRPRPSRPAFGGNRNGRPVGGRPYREGPADGTQTRRRPGTVAGSTAPTGRVRDPGPDAESRMRRPYGPPQGAARPAGNRAGPARPRRAPFNSSQGTPVGQRGRGPARDGAAPRASGTYSEHGAAGRRAAPRKQAGAGGATTRPTGRPAPGRSAPRTSKPRSPRA